MPTENEKSTQEEPYELIDVKITRGTENDDCEKDSIENFFVSDEEQKERMPSLQTKLK